MAWLAMGDLAWTVITDIDFSQIDKAIDQISDEINRHNTHLATQTSQYISSIELQAWILTTND